MLKELTLIVADDKSLIPASEIRRKDFFHFIDKVSRIYLKRYPATDEDSDYLSAVYVDGVRLQNQYLAAQLPMPSTINDFWRMIAEYKVELILMLQPPDPQDPVRAIFLHFSTRENITK